MASDPSKTERATPKRRDKTREEGNVPKSQEVTKAVTTAAAVLGLSVYLGVMVQHLQTVYRYFLTESFFFKVDAQSVYALMLFVFAELAIILLPVLLLIGFTAWVTLRIQVGSLWSTKAFEFKWTRFNIFNGLKNMFFSVQTLVRLGRSLLQAVVIGLVPYGIIMGEFDNFLPLYYASPAGVGEYMLKTGMVIVLYTLIPMFVIAGADLWYTRYEYEENIKMTKQEIKDEHKQSEGDPMVKSQQRQKMMQMLNNRSLKEVPRADVVITNPTHIAVALRYNVIEAPAPVIVAMGVDHLAEKIKQIARENNVPIRENVPLARALYKNAAVGDMIPEELYKATASVLASIWKLKGKRPGM
ncbi:MAG: flagellar biosynthesis protein FlhB [Bilophila sp.]